MSKVIFKSMYLKSAEGGIKHALNLVDYVARREGVLKSEAYKFEGEATSNQHTLINEISNVIDVEKNTFFKQYALFPTKENASRFIANGLQQINRGDECITDPKILLNYIAERPGVLGSKCDEIQHGLFDLKGDVRNITKAKQQMSLSGSNIHHHIISIKVEDAHDIGMDNKQEWEALVRRHAIDLAKQSNISYDDLGLVGAVHENDVSFHVHLMQYSKSNDRNMFFTDKALETLRKSITKDVFKNQLRDIANNRDNFNNLNITSEMIASIDEDLIMQLKHKLDNHKGRMFYGYLDSDTKELLAKVLDQVFRNNEELKIKLDKYLDEQVKYHAIFNKVEDESILKLELYNKFLYPSKKDKTTLHNKILQLVAESNINEHIVEVDTVNNYSVDEVRELEHKLYDEIANNEDLKTENGNIVTDNDSKVVSKSKQPLKGLYKENDEIDKYFSEFLYKLETGALKEQFYIQASNGRISSETVKEVERVGYLDDSNYQIKHSNKYLLFFANSIKSEIESQKQINELHKKREHNRRRKRSKKRRTELNR